MSNILIVDDEKEIADLIEIYLKNENYNVYKYYSSEHIMNDLENIKIDLAILDIMMPGVDGFSLCEEIRKKYNFPIIFVTAKVENNTVHTVEGNSNGDTCRQKEYSINSDVIFGYGTPAY